MRLIRLITLDFSHPVYESTTRYAFEIYDLGMNRVQVKRIPVDGSRSVKHGDWDSVDEFIEHHRTLHKAVIVTDVTI